MKSKLGKRGVGFNNTLKPCDGWKRHRKVRDESDLTILSNYSSLKLSHALVRDESDLTILSNLNICNFQADFVINL